jgi:hypothetical protein
MATGRRAEVSSDLLKRYDESRDANCFLKCKKFARIKSIEFSAIQKFYQNCRESLHAFAQANFSSLLFFVLDMNET